MITKISPITIPCVKVIRRGFYWEGILELKNRMIMVSYNNDVYLYQIKNIKEFIEPVRQYYREISHPYVGIYCLYNCWYLSEFSKKELVVKYNIQSSMYYFIVVCSIYGEKYFDFWDQINRLLKGLTGDKCKSLKIGERTWEEWIHKLIHTIDKEKREKAKEEFMRAFQDHCKRPEVMQSMLKYGNLWQTDEFETKESTVFPV